MGQKRSLVSGAVEAHAATLLFGLAGLFAKWIRLPSPVIVLGRVLFASVALGLIIFGHRLRWKPLSRRDGFFLFGLGFLLAFHWIVFFHSIKLSTVAVGLLAYSSFPIFTSFLEPILLRESFHLETAVAAVFCFFGVFWLIPSFHLSDAIFQGVIWGILAGLSFSLLSIANRRLGRTYNSLVLAFYQDAAATIILFPWVISQSIFPAKMDMVRLVFLGVVCTAGAHSLFIEGMKKITARTASIISTLEPVYGIILAYLILKEMPTCRTILGGVIILISVLVITWRSSRQEEKPA